MLVRRDPRVSCYAVSARRATALQIYYRSVTANPRHVRSLYYFALYMGRQKKKLLDFIQLLYERALRVNPVHCNTLKDYAMFR